MKNLLYKVVSFNPYTHNLIYGDDVSAIEGFMLTGRRDTALNVCAMLNTALKESRKPVPPKKPKQISVPKVDDVINACRFRPMATPRYMIEQTILYCAKVFDMGQENP